MGQWSFFHRAMDALQKTDYIRAERLLKKSLSIEKHPLAREYLAFVWLVLGKWKQLSLVMEATPLWEGVGLYVRYWYLWVKESWLDLEPCLYQMLGSDNLFVRIFALFRLRYYHQKGIEEFLSQRGIWEGICGYQRESERAARYRAFLEGRSESNEYDLGDREAFLDMIFLESKEKAWEKIREVSKIRLWRHLSSDVRILWEASRLAFENAAYDQAKQWLLHLHRLGFVRHVVWYLLGHLFSAQKKWQKAALWYEKSIESGLDTPDVWKNLAILTLEQGYLKDAFAYFRESLRLKNDPEVLYALALIALRRRDYVQAYELLRRCLGYEEVREMAQNQIEVLKRLLRETAF